MMKCKFKGLSYRDSSKKVRNIYVVKNVLNCKKIVCKCQEINVFFRGVHKLCHLGKVGEEKGVAPETIY